MASSAGSQSAQLRIQRDFVNALEQCDAVRSEGNRQLLAELLSDSFGDVVPLRGQAPLRVQLFELVRYCCKQPEGLNTLLESVLMLVPRVPEGPALAHLCGEWHALKGFPTDDWDLFRKALQSVRLADDPVSELRVLRNMVRIATGSRVQELPAGCHTAWDGFVFMAGANTAAGGLPPAMIFLDCVARQVEDRGLADQFGRWNRAWAETFEVTELLDNAPWRPAQGSVNQASPVYLVIQLDPDPSDSDLFVLTHWRQWDAYGLGPQRQAEAPVAGRDLEQEVDELISELESELGVDSSPTEVGPIFLEFVLPWEMLNLPIEFWCKSSLSNDRVPLAIDHPVVLRSLDRMRAHRYRLAWKRRWISLSGQSVDNRPYWSQPSGRDYFTRLAAELSVNENIVSLVLSEPPGDRDSMAWREVAMAFRAGIPAILWDREDCSAGVFREAVAAMLADGPMVHLPHRVAALRRDALRTQPSQVHRHAGRSMAILWDDPDRLPEPRHWPGLEMGSGG